LLAPFKSNKPKSPKKEKKKEDAKKEESKEAAPAEVCCGALAFDINVYSLSPSSGRPCC
jgi:hypothetical protein